MLEIVVVDGEETVTVESIKESTLIGAEASKRGLCFHCAAFRGREIEGEVDIYFDSPLIGDLKINSYVKACRKCLNDFKNLLATVQ
jgi:hypothetical protein